MSIIAAIVMLGILVFVHELGHFIAFKAIGVKVLKFSIGFPPVLIQKKIGETVYQIGWIPLGGYVKALGETDLENVTGEDSSRALMNKPPKLRLITFAAGPVMNLIFPVFLYWCVFMLPAEELSSKIGMIVDGMPAAEAGILPGDRIKAVDGKGTEFWSDLLKEISTKPGRQITLTIDRGGRIFDVRLIPETVTETDRLGEKREEGRIGVAPYGPEARIFVKDGSAADAAGLKSWDLVTAVNDEKVTDWSDFREKIERAGNSKVRIEVIRRDIEKDTAEPDGKTSQKKHDGSKKTLEVNFAGGLAGAGVDSSSIYIRTVDPGGPAQAAGLKPGDRVVSIDGRKVSTWGTVEDSFRRNPDKEFLFLLARGSEIYQARLKLIKKTIKDEFRQEHTVWSIGAVSDSSYAEGDYSKRGFNPMLAAREAVNGTWEAVSITYRAIYQLVSGRMPLNTVGGPIMIFDMAGTVAKKGIGPYLWLMALLSINLGIFNLLPIPILDGGHILLTSIEMIIRKPLSQRVRLFSTYMGFAFLMSIMILVFKNDIERYWDLITGIFR